MQYQVILFSIKNLLVPLLESICAASMHVLVLILTLVNSTLDI